MDPFLKLIRDIDLRGWVRRYVEHGVNTETPAAFRCMAALTLVSAMLKRKIYVEKGIFQVYPPFQCLLIGPSSLARKTTSVDYGQRLIQKYVRRDMQPVFLPNGGSPEGFLQDLADAYAKSPRVGEDGRHPEGKACGLQVVDELSAFLTKAKYAEHMITLLLRLYDSPSQITVATKRSGKQVIENVGVAALLASNEHLLAQAIPESAIKAGFPARVVFMWETYRPPKVANPEDVMPSQSETAALGKWLEKLVPKDGEVIQDPEGKAWAKAWYDSITEANDPDIDPFMARIQGHMLRIAMLISASSTEEHRVKLDKEHYQQSVAILDYTLKRLPALYRVLATGPFGIQYETVKRTISAAGGSLEKSKLGRKLSHKMSHSQLNEVLASMQANGEIDMEMTLGRRDHTVRLRK